MALVVSTSHLLGIIDCNVYGNMTEERIFGYLTTMIGNMGINELRNFLRLLQGAQFVLLKPLMYCLMGDKTHLPIRVEVL